MQIGNTRAVVHGKPRDQGLKGYEMVRGAHVLKNGRKITNIYTEIL